MDIISCCIHLSSGQVKLNNNLICSRLYLSAAILDQEVIYRSDFVVRIYRIEPVLSFPFSSSFRSKIVRTSSLQPLILGVFGAIGALIGATITSLLLTEEILKPAFGLVIGLGALRMLTWKPQKTAEVPKAQPLTWACCGFSIGIICGMLGLGGGIITVPVLAMALKFKMHHAVGTSLSMMIFTSVAGSIGYLINGLSVPNLPPYSIGYVNLLAWACLAMTSIPVAQIGAKTAHKLPATQLRHIFIAVMFYVALKMMGAFEWLGLPI